MRESALLSTEALIALRELAGRMRAAAETLIRGGVFDAAVSTEVDRLVCIEDQLVQLIRERRQSERRAA